MQFLARAFESRLVVFFLFLLLCFCAVGYHWPIELARHDFIYLKTFAAPEQFLGHLNFPKSYFENSYFRFHVYFLKLSALLGVSWLTLAYLIFAASLFGSSFLMWRIARLLGLTKPFALYLLFLWIFDLGLIQYQWHFSSFADEVRHYNVGLPIVLGSLLCFLTGRYWLALGLVGVAQWISPPCLLIGIPILCSAIFRFASKKDIYSMAFMLALLAFFLFQSLNVIATFFFVRDPELGSWLTAFYYQRNTFFTSPVTTILTALLSLLACWLVSREGAKDPARNTASFSDARLLYAVSTGLFIGYAFACDFLNFRAMSGVRIAERVTWVSQVLGTLFIVKACQMSSPSASTLWRLIFIFPIWRFLGGLDGSDAAAISLALLFISSGCIGLFPKWNRLALASTAAALAALAGVVLTGDASQHAEKVGLLVALAALLLIDFGCLYGGRQNANLRRFAFTLVVASIAAGLCVKGIRHYSTAAPPGIERNATNTDFRAVCEFLKRANDTRSAVLLPPELEVQQEFLILTDLPLLPIFDSILTLAFGILPTQTWKSAYTDFFGADFFENLPQEYLASGGAIFRQDPFRPIMEDRMRDRWRDMDPAIIPGLVRKYNLRFIVREKAAPLAGLAPIYENAGYRVYDVLRKSTGASTP